MQEINNGSTPQKTSALERDKSQSMNLDDIVVPSVLEPGPVALESTGLTLSQFGSVGLSGDGGSISSASTLRHVGGNHPSIAFTFASGIATAIASADPSVSLINSNLPFAETPPAPTFLAAQLSPPSPSPVVAPSSTPENKQELHEVDKEPEANPNEV